MTPSARLSPLTKAQARDAGRSLGIPEKMADLSMLRVLLHHPALCEKLYALLDELLFRGDLEERLRELIILRVAWVTKSEYVWTQHYGFAKRMGISEADILAVRRRSDWERLGRAECAVLAATEETLQDGAVSAETWNTCESVLEGSGKKLLEVVVAIGTWNLCASVLHSLNIPAEEVGCRWPPDGLRP